MNWKELHKSNVGFVIEMCIGAFIVCLIIFFATFGWLRGYTHHGDEVVVPDIKGMFIEEAQMYLNQNGLSLVVIDSTFSATGKYKTHGTIVEQNPPAGANTKNGRMVYAVVLSKSNRQVVLPQLHDLSYRQAQVTLSSLGISISDVVYQPSSFAGLVIGVQHKGVEIEAGTKLNEGDNVVLIVGQNHSSNGISAYVPTLTGMSLSQARQALLNASLILGGTIYDVEPTEETQAAYRVYDQDPSSGVRTNEGGRVNIYLTTDPNKKAENHNHTEEEEFF